MFAGRASEYLGACVTDQSHDDVIAAVAEVYGCFIGGCDWMVARR